MNTSIDNVASVTKGAPLNHSSGGISIREACGGKPRGLLVLRTLEITMPLIFVLSGTAFTPRSCHAREAFSP